MKVTPVEEFKIGECENMLDLQEISKQNKEKAKEANKKRKKFGKKKRRVLNKHDD